MSKIFPTILLFLLAFSVFAQSNKEEKSFGVSLKGFIKSELFFDSRQTVSVREGHLLLYPQPENNDLNDEDINATPNLNMLSIQTRITGIITAPDAFGAKTSGVIEGAFFGHSNGDINGFRLRHAYLKLDWKNSSLLIGQYWHPMFITEVFPGVISFNTGMPFSPFSRNPQIKFINKFDNVHLSLTAATQRDFSNSGPNGTSSQYLRNSAIPILDVNLKFKNDDIVAGLGVNYKTIKPYAEYNGHKVKDKMSSYSAMVFTKLNLGDVNIKMEGVYGTNLTDLVMLGGYAIKNYDNNGEIEYTGTKTLSAWTDVTYGTEITFGLFAGYTKNLGTEDINNLEYFSRGSNIDIVCRIAPRLQRQMGKTRIACELEYTTAAYGTPDLNGEVQNTSSVSNLRLLIAAYLFF